MLFCLLDPVQEQISLWYYLQFTITDKDNDKDEFFFPLLACMRNAEGARSLQQQIQKDLERYFSVSSPEIETLTKQAKDLKVQAVTVKMENHQTGRLNIVIHTPKEKKILPPEASLFNGDDLNSDNLRTNVSYDRKTLQYEIGIIKNEGVPIDQIRELLTVRVDSGLIDPATDAPEPERPAGGSTERMIDIIKKTNK